MFWPSDETFCPRCHSHKSMNSFTDQQLADALLTIVAAIPTDVPWNVVAVHGLGIVLAWDVREEADSAILDALAGELGEVVASSVDHHDVGGRQIVADRRSAGCRARTDARSTCSRFKRGSASTNSPG